MSISSKDLDVILSLALGLTVCMESDAHIPLGSLDGLNLVSELVNHA